MGNKGKRAGSVTAEIKLDTKQFDESIQKLISKVGDLKEGLVNNGSERALSDLQKLSEHFGIEADSIETTITALENKINAYKDSTNSQKKATDSNKKLTDSEKKVQDIIEKNQSTLDMYAKANENVVKTKEKLNNVEKESQSITDSLLKGTNDLINNTKKESQANKDLTKSTRDANISSKELIDSISKASASARRIKQLTTSVADLGLVVERTSKKTHSMYDLFDPNLKYTYKELWNIYDQLPKEIQTALQGINRAMYKDIKSLNYSPYYDEYSAELKAWKKFIPMMHSIGDTTYRLYDDVWSNDGIHSGWIDLTNLKKQNEILNEYVKNVEELDKYYASRKPTTAFNGGRAEFTKVELANLRRTLRLLKEIDTVTNTTTGEVVKLSNAHKTNSESIEKENKAIDKNVKKIKQESQAIASLKKSGYNFGFTGLDAKDARFIRNTLTELQTGAITGAGRIRPKDPLLRLFNEEEIKFAEHLFHATQTYDDKKQKWTHKGIIPYKDFFTTSMYWGGEGNWGERLGGSFDDKEGKKIAKQIAQQSMAKVFDYLGVELISATGRGGHKFNGKGISGIDVTALGDNWMKVRAEMDKAIDVNKKFQREDARIFAQQRKISELSEAYWKKIPEEKRELLDVCRVADELNEKFTRLYRNRDKLAKKPLKLGFKVNGTQFTKDVENAILDVMKHGKFERTAMSSQNARINQRMKENRLRLGIDENDFLHEDKSGRFYVQIDGALEKIHLKYQDIIKDELQYQSLLNKAKSSPNKLKGTFLTGKAEGHRYYPSTSELIDIFGSSYMESSYAQIQQGEKAFGDLIKKADGFTFSAKKANTEVHDLNSQLVQTQKYLNRKQQRAEQKLLRRQEGRRLATLFHEERLNITDNLTKASVQANNLKTLIMQIGEAEEKTTKSTHELSNSLRKSVDSFVGEVPKVVNGEKDIVIETKKVGESFKNTSSNSKGLTESISKVSKIDPKPIQEYTQVINQLGKVSGEVRTKVGNLRREMRIFSKQPNWESLVNPFKKVYGKNIFQQLDYLDMESGVLFDVDSRNLQKWGINGKGEIVNRGFVANTTKSLRTLDSTVLSTAKHIKIDLAQSIEKLMKAMKNDDDFVPPYEEWEQAFAEIESFVRRYERLQQRMYELSRKNYSSITKNKVNTGYGAVLTDQMYKKYMDSYKYDNGMHIPYIDRKSFERLGSKGRVDVYGYSDYVANISRINKANTEATVSTERFKETLINLASSIKSTNAQMGNYSGSVNKAVASMTRMAETNEVYTGMRKLGQTLNHFSGVSDKNKKSLAGLRSEYTALRDSLSVLTDAFRRGELSPQQYNSEIQRLTKNFNKLGVTAQNQIRKLNMEKVKKETKESSKDMDKFANTFRRADTYGNKLYQGLQRIKGTIVSVKTIFTAMGGMALWGFAFDLIESAKETFSAKNEIESQLLANKNVNKNNGANGRGGMQLFNKGLDDTVKKFKKINKYSIGETVSSIGLEFDLSAKEMQESMDIISMVQSEYVRAGRKESEAALAVKDILQGEFMRLSRETGVGAKDLEEYGWSGDKKDVLGMMKAIRKVAKERHWDVFASKATSLNDILTITKSRFSEFGADFLQSLTPALISGFNAISDAIDSISKSFGGLDDFQKSIAVLGGAPAIILTVSSAYLALSRNIGFADIAMMGWHKSVLTGLFGLKKLDVATYGFKSTLLAMISGTKAEEVATRGFTKSLMARLLGTDQVIAGNYGLLSSIVANKLQIKGEKTAMDAMILATGKWHQKLAYLMGNIKATTAQTYGLGQSLKTVITSTRLWGLALKGVLIGGFIAFIASIAQKAQYAKSQVDGFYNVVDNGKDLVKDAKSEFEGYVKSIDNINAKIADYKAKGKDTWKLERNLAKETQNRIQAYKNLGQAQYANTLAEKYNKKRQKELSDTNLKYQKQLTDVYKANGATQQQAEISANKYVAEVINGNYFIKQGNKDYKNRLSLVEDHLIAQTKAMELAGADQQAREKYINEYGSKVQEVAENWKKFREGDMLAGLNVILGELTLHWIDIANRPEVVILFRNLGLAWRDMQPTITYISNGLGNIVLRLVDVANWLSRNQVFLNTAPWIGLGVGLAYVGNKLLGLADKGKSTISTFSNIAKSIKDNIGKLRAWRKERGKTDKAESPEKGKSKTTPESDIPDKKSKKYANWRELGADIKQDFMGEARRFAKVASQIALAMGVVSVAIASMLMPALALAGVGILIKGHEGQIKSGIEGLKLLAPTVLALLPPVVALMYVMQKYEDQLTRSKIGRGFIYSVAGIAMGMSLVAEAIAFIIPSIWALSAVGDQYSNLAPQVRKGVKAMQIVSDSLKYLLPFIPALAGGILLGISIFESGLLGGALTLAVVGGIAIGIGLVAETILALEMPLWSLGRVGENFKDLSNVKQGAKALKVTASALKYVEEAMGSLAGINFSNLIMYITDFVGGKIGFEGVDLSSLTEKDGFLDQLNKFIKGFNNLTIESPIEENVTALNNASGGLKSIGDAMKTAKTAMDNLPDEFKKGSSQFAPTASLFYNGNNSKLSGNISATSGVSYFDQFKEPLRELKEFVDEFNTGDEFNIKEVDSTRLENINKSADMITQIDNAVTKVKSTMQKVGQAGHETAFAEGGWFGALGYDVIHQTGLGVINNGQSSGSYKSSLGGSLKQMEDVVSDIFTFQTNISKYTGSGGENANVDGATAMVTTVQDAISKLATSLSNAVPQFKGKGNAISKAIIDGINQGLSGITNIGTGIVNKIANGVMNNKDTLYNTMNSLGLTSARKFKTGVDPMSEMMGWELFYVNQQLTGEYYDKIGTSAYNLGVHASDKYREGLDMNSPGAMARSTEEEIGYIQGFLQNGITNLPQMAMSLGNSLSSNFNLDFNLSNFQLPDMTSWTSKLTTVLPTINNIKTQVSTSFNGMKTNVQNSFNGIVSKTRTSLTNMQSATTKNIGNIKTSWRGMQNALIASAEHIRTQTTTKINNLKTNMASFWKKIQNPSLLIGGSAGSPSLTSHGTRKRRYVSRKSSVANMGFAGTPSKKTGIITRKKGTNSEVREQLEILLQGLLEGKPMYAGGWNFNWAKKIQSKFNNWHTHFGEIYDGTLRVGKFYNNDFPVKGDKTIAKNYIADAIKRTTYDFYYNSRYGDNPLSAWLSGAFNCWDGTQVVLALARAFGFSGDIGHGTWNGIPHVFARIPELGIIDPTALQKGYGFKSPAVRYSGTPSKKSDLPKGDTIINNTTEININSPVYGVDELHKEIDKGVQKAQRKLFINKLSGV